jgi:hypothetical protein
MDKLQVFERAEKRGGEERKEAIVDMAIAARKLGCDLDIGGGRAGGINIRYGSIGYALMDVNTNGRVKLYVQPHPGKDSSDEYIDEMNGYIEEDDHLEAKSFPINSYGHLEDPIEEIPHESIEGFLHHAMSMIRERFYIPHMEL